MSSNPTLNLIWSNHCMYEYATTQVETRNLPPFRDYISLLRFHYHSSFVGILLGALVVTRDWQWPLLWRLFLVYRSEEHTSELQSQSNLVCRLLLEKKKKKKKHPILHVYHIT